MTTSREEMIAHIAQTWTDEIDINDYLTSMYFEYEEVLDHMSDEAINCEYKAQMDETSND